MRGLAVAPDGETAVSASADCTVKLWKVPYAPFESGAVQADATPVVEFVGKHAFSGVDFHWATSRFATSGACVDIWDSGHSDPIQTFSWGTETVLSVRFNPVRSQRLKGWGGGTKGGGWARQCWECGSGSRSPLSYPQAEADVFASTGSDRSIALYDLRQSTPIRKLVMQTRSNAVAWNPMEPLNFAVASEDCNLYTYDMRKLNAAACVHEVRAGRGGWVRGAAGSGARASAGWMMLASAMAASCSGNSAGKTARWSTHASSPPRAFPLPPAFTRCPPTLDPLQDFVSAVMDVEFSPTGRELVAASYDRSVRLFRYNGGHSHECYTAKRMQRVFCARYSGDATYVITGSDDFNVRIWKARVGWAVLVWCYFRAAAVWPVIGGSSSRD